jgi:hypothetical protein
MTIYRQEKDTMVTWDGRRRPFQEAYFLKFNLPDSQKAVWLRFTLLAPMKKIGSPTASVWAMIYDKTDPQEQFAMKRTLVDEEWVIDRDIFFFQIGDCSIYNTGMRGEISDGKHHLNWDIYYQVASESVYQYPAFFYLLPFPKTKVKAPNWNILLNGTIEIDGKEHLIQNIPGTQMHLYGSGYSEKWSWGHCNTFQDHPGACFEYLSGQIKIKNRLSPPMTLALLEVDGKKYYFNQTFKLFSNKARYDVEGCALEASSGKYRLEMEARTRSDLMMGIPYTDVDGSLAYCHHDEFTSYDLRLLKKEKGSWVTKYHLQSKEEGALEVVLRKLDEEIKLYL